MLWPPPAGLLEMWWKWWVVELIVKEVIFAINGAVDMVSSFASFVCNGLDNTLQAIAVVDISLKVVGSVTSNSLFLLSNHILKFEELSTHPLKLGDLILNSELREISILAGRLKSLWVWIGDNVIWNRRIRLDVDDFGFAGLPE